LSDDVKAVYNPLTGYTNNYFGGVGAPDGPGHGHVGVNEQGMLDIMIHPYVPGAPNGKLEATQFDARGVNPHFNPNPPQR